jgi:exocyst complex component 8
MSACVKWAKEHVDQFNILLKRQLSSVDEGGKLWTECMLLAHEHASMLKEVGLDFSELVGSGVRDGELPPQEPVGLGLS